MTQLALDRLRPFSIGLDSFFSFAEGLASQATSFPPYNVYKVDDNTHLIELAVAGYKKEDINITADNDVLEITGSVSNEPEKGKLIYKGISSKSFTRSFRLGSNIIVKDASMSDGFLTITLQHIEPKNKSNKIAIN